MTSAVYPHQSRDMFRQVDKQGQWVHSLMLKWLALSRDALKMRLDAIRGNNPPRSVQQHLETKVVQNRNAMREAEGGVGLYNDAAKRGKYSKRSLSNEVKHPCPSMQLCSAFLDTLDLHPDYFDAD